MKILIQSVLFIAVFLMATSVQAKPSKTCPIDAKLEDGKCVCSTPWHHFNDEAEKALSETEALSNFNEIMKKFEPQINQCFEQNLKHITVDDITPYYNKEPICKNAQFCKQAYTDIAMFSFGVKDSVSIEFIMQANGKFHTKISFLNEQKTKYLQKVNKCIDKIFSNTSFCPGKVTTETTETFSYTYDFEQTGEQFNKFKLCPNQKTEQKTKAKQKDISGCIPWQRLHDCLKGKFVIQIILLPRYGTSRITDCI